MLLLASLSLLACKKVEPAPADLDGLLHWFWQKYEAGEEEELHEGVVNAFDIVDVEALAEEVQDGSISDLDADEAALVGVTDRDPADAAGMYLLTVFDCDLQTLQEVVAAPDQDALYEGIYDDYERTFTGDDQAYLSGEEDLLAWDVWYAASYLGGSYEAESKGGLRRVPEIDAEVSPHGDVVLQRTWMPEPAVWESDGPSYDQDYQIEVYVDAGEGRVLHLYGLWRQAEYPGGFSSDNESVQRVLLNNLAKWDETTEGHCATGLP